MSFTAVKSDTGAVLPWEYLPAKKGDYKCGQVVDVNAGKVGPMKAASAAKAPAYLCAAERTVADGELLPVVRVGAGTIFETTLSAAGSVQVGSLLAIDAKGLEADGSVAGAFEVTSLEVTRPEGAAQGDIVRGRFV